MLPTLDDIRAAAARIDGIAYKTPLLRCEALDAMTGARTYVKAECLQRGGAFKIRGAVNKIASLSETERKNGVLAYSSGNHAIAVATAARIFGIPATIVMPADAPRAKLERTRSLGAEVITYDRVNERREEISKRLERERGLPLVKPFDDPFVMAGQGTIGLEIVEALDAEGVAAQACVFSPASGGGLAGGIAIALGDRARVIAVEPEGHDDLARSREAGHIVENAPGMRSICDALLVQHPSALTLEAARAHLAGVVTASDRDVLRAMRFAFDELKLVIEPGGAIGLAAAMHTKLQDGGVIVVIASGGNVDGEVYDEALAAPL